MDLEILYEDNHLLAVSKPGGMLVQGDRTRDPSALDLARDYLKRKYGKPGNVFLGLVHRIDRPVSGVVVFARTSKAASRLARAFHDRQVEKKYLAVVVGHPPEKVAEIESFVARSRQRSVFAEPESPGAKRARLLYRMLAIEGGVSLLEVQPSTGRHHQIRLQLSGEGMPIVGDLKYGAPEALADKTIALHAWLIAFDHPVRHVGVRVVCPPPTAKPWARFAATIDRRFQTGG